MKKSILFSSILVLMMAVACKKEKTEELIIEEPTKQVETEPDSFNLSGTIRMTDSVQIVYDPLLGEDKLVEGNIGVRAEFYDIPGTGTLPSSIITSLSLNGMNVPNRFDSYNLFSNIPKNVPYTWHLKGNTSIPNFTYIHDVGMPGYADYKQLPWIIDRSKDTKIELTGFSNHSYAALIIDDNISVGHHLLLVNAENGTMKPFTLSPSEVNDFTPTTNGTLELRVDKYSYKVFEGKTFRFIDERVFWKTIVIK